MSEVISVKKWGGENAAELVKSPRNVLVDHINGIKQAVIVSAIRSSSFNTTDKLIEVGEMIKSKSSFLEVKSKLIEIRDFHFSIIDEKLSIDTNDIKDFINGIFDNLILDIYKSSEYKIFPTKENDYSIMTSSGLRSLVGFGEELSAYVHEKVISGIGIDAKFVNLNGVVPENSERLKEQELFERLSREISTRVEQVLCT